MKSKLSNENEVRMIVDARPGHSLDLQNKHFRQAASFLASFLASGLSFGLLRRSHVDLIIIIILVVVLLRHLDFHIFVNDNINVNQVFHMFCDWRRPMPFIVNNQSMNPIPMAVSRLSSYCSMSLPTAGEYILVGVVYSLVMLS